MNHFTMNFEPCEMCLNARVWVPTSDLNGNGLPDTDDDDILTDETDFSSVPVGSCIPGYGLRVDSGYGRSVRIEATEWDPKSQKNVTVSCYMPKFCPNCGRPLVEYDRLRREYDLADLPLEWYYWIKKKGLLNLEKEYFHPVRELFLHWQPDDAHWDTDKSAACLEYLNGDYMITVSSSKIEVHTQNAVASFKHSELKECMKFMAGIFDKSTSSSPTNLFE